MAETNNFTEISENFDTIKTLLNSIRAQGILNTSDVDKLLSGINAKLEKINTEEDIDLIKVFLTELKKTFDERHNVLISKFGAIESLFTNLLKNSNELTKSSEIKELFDVVATNLSVFSREVVAQKETLTDITMRLDAIRSDDTQKKEIIKNITLLKPDLERLNNGFDSIVLSLNDNFKTIVKTISTIDKTEYLDRFSNNLGNIEMSANALLSAIQLLDKKTETIDDYIKNTATKDDLNITQQKINELHLLNQDINNNVTDLSTKYRKLDTLAEKIDASVSIVAGLKAVLEESDNENTKKILNSLNELNNEIQTINSDTKFEKFKEDLTVVLRSLAENISANDKSIALAGDELKKINNFAKDLNLTANFSDILTAIEANENNVKDFIRTLDVNTGFSSVISTVETNETNIKNFISETSSKTADTNSVNTARVISTITANADNINSKLAQAHGEISDLCDKSFESVFQEITDLKTIVSQIDDNGVSANNAMFANISDRLNLFENTLSDAIKRQDTLSSESSAKLDEQIESIKNASGVIDYKMDSSVVEISGLKTEFGLLKNSVNDVLALNFTETVKDLRADLYSAKQELSNAFENSSSSLTDKFSADLFGKYELLISKMNSVEEDLKQIQVDTLNELKSSLQNISSSLVDVISYVSNNSTAADSEYDRKFEELSSLMKDTSLNYVENVRDVVDIVRIQVENSLKTLDEESSRKFEQFGESLITNTGILRDDIKLSYEKLLEVQKSYNEIKEMLDLNTANNNNKFDNVLNVTAGINEQFDSKVAALKTDLLNKISDIKQDFTCENTDKLSEMKFNTENLYNKTNKDMTEGFKEVHDKLGALTADMALGRQNSLSQIISGIQALKKNIDIQSENNSAQRNDGLNQISTSFEDLTEKINSMSSDMISGREAGLNKMVSELQSLKADMENLSQSNSTQRTGALAQIIENFGNLTEDVKALATETSLGREAGLNKILTEMLALKTELETQGENNSAQRADGLAQISDNFNNLAEKLKTLSGEIALGRENGLKSLISEIDFLKNVIEDKFKDSDLSRTAALAKLLENFVGMKDYVSSVSNNSDETISKKFEELSAELEVLKSTLNKVDENVDGDMTRQLSIIESNFEALISQITILCEKSEKSLTDKISDEYESISDKIQESVSAKLENYKQKIEETFDRLSEKANYQSNYIQDRIAEMNAAMKEFCSEQDKNYGNRLDELLVSLQEFLNDNINQTSVNYESFRSSIDTFTNSIESNNVQLIEKLKAQLDDVTKYLDSVLDIQVQETGTKYDELASLVNRNTLVHNESAAQIKTALGEQLTVSQSSLQEVQNISDIVKTTKEELLKIENSISENLDNFNTINNEKAENRSIVLETGINKLAEQIETEKKILQVNKDFIADLIQKKLEAVSGNIEHETDAIIAELTGQFELLRKSQSDEVLKLTSEIDGIVANQIYNNIEDLKSYLDVKTDTFVLTDKLDNFKNDITATFDKIVNNLNKMLLSDSFTTAMNDYKVANEVLISSATEELGNKITAFVTENATSLAKSHENGIKVLESKLNLFDKKFVDTITENYENIKLITNKYNTAFNEIKGLLNQTGIDFENVKTSIDEKIENIITTINSSVEVANSKIELLHQSFEGLRSQISNKSFDEAFQASINKQIASLEGLIQQQADNIEDLNELSDINLPYVPEIHSMLQTTVLPQIDKFSANLQELDDRLGTDKDEVKNILQKDLNNLKSDVITQFLNIFNQISFVAEQEEILDFIQEKHDELITVLSHIVDVSSDVTDIKYTTGLIDDKLNSVKSEISSINEKINNILSSDGNIDYIYSLQDLETDIANLRVVLQEIKTKQDDSNLTKLISSTENVYNLVESLKEDAPSKKDIESIAEDIVSISTRTNKLILASDESYKTLQENLKDFKLVINDLDERTRNFAEETGIDKIDNKLNKINTKLANGEKTNQIFNEIFEYLAEWIDKASVQINDISNRVGSLDNIDQIKTILTNMREESEDNTENIELIEALGNVFDKQAKKISKIETKLDKIIVETTINNKSSKLDITPLENTLNGFLAAMGEKISSQQERINSLEEKLEGVLNLLDEKDTAQLTKKVGGMDRQIAKLNKSIEKIASHVIEK